MKNSIIILVVLVCMVIHTNRVVASDRNVRNMTPRERIFVGGFLGLQIGTLTTVSVHLHGGYLVTNRLTLGLGGNYQYTNNRWFGESFSSHIYGAGAFARFDIISGFFAHAEYERLSLQSYIPDTPPGERPRIREDNYFIGAGYGLPLSERVRLNILMLYNLNQNSQVYFDNPFFRLGVDVYLFN